MNKTIKYFSFQPNELDFLKSRMLHWANAQSDILLFLDNNHYHHTHGRYECVLGVGAQEIFCEADADFKKLRQYRSQSNDWLLGHVAYDFKNCLEQLDSKHTDNLGFAEIQFFKPQVVCWILRNATVLCIESKLQHPDQIWQEIQQFPTKEIPNSKAEIHLQKRIEKAAYCNIISQLKEHIRQGDCYEINFCNEAFCDDVTINPLTVFEKLNQVSPAPFAAYYRSQNSYLMSASPERYLYKSGQKVIAQPIKGTAARKATETADRQAKIDLQQNIKERAENLMIVDLMRNDLARFCQLGSVRVEELLAVYTFPQVHQLISTICGEICPDKDVFDALKYTFPMGSMTGAPKIMVMQLIEHYEAAMRSLFSGTVGYINPEGDFDFNVVIRSLFYNSANKYLSYQTGGAITFDSDPEQEWAETCLKAMAIEKVLQS